MSELEEEEEQHYCDCARFCKGRKKAVGRSTFYAHKPFRRRFVTPVGTLAAQAETAQDFAFGQAPPIADIIGANPNLNMGAHPPVGSQVCFC